MASGIRAKTRARTKQAIYSAAMELFATKGFHETTVDEIAAAAEVSRATFFNYFGTKDGVLRHFSEQLASEMSRVFEESKSDPSPLNRIQKYLTCWLNYIAQHQEAARQVYRHTFASPGDLLNQSPTRQRLYLKFVEVVGQGQAQGEIRSDMPTEHLAGLILSVYQSAVISFLFANVSLAQLLDSVWRFVLHGVCAPADPAPSRIGEVETAGGGEPPATVSDP